MHIVRERMKKQIMLSEPEWTQKTNKEALGQVERDLKILKAVIEAAEESIATRNKEIKTLLA